MIGKCAVFKDVGNRLLSAADLLQRLPVDAHRDRHDHARRGCQQRAGAVARHAGDALGRIQHRTRPVLRRRSATSCSSGTILIGFADGDEHHIVIRQRGGKGQVRRRHTACRARYRMPSSRNSSGVLAIRSPGAHDGEQADGCRAIGRRQVIQLLHLQRLGLYGECDVAVALQLQHRRQIHQGIGIVRMRLCALRADAPPAGPRSTPEKAILIKRPGR